MAFVKLDCGMLDSTLWFDRPAREVFITALLMAVPWQTREPMEQLEVRNLKTTGFVVPPGWYGFVAAAGPAIVERAKVEQIEGIEALQRLGAQDITSRTPDYEGRRMVRVDGGYVVLNYEKYRSKDHTAADRARRYREKKSEGHHAVIPLRHGVTGRNVTQAEAYKNIKEWRAKEMSLEECLKLAEVRGISKDVAEAWWLKMDGQGWLTDSGLPAKRPESLMLKYSNSCRANECKAKLKESRSLATTRKPSVLDLKTIMAAKTAEATELKNIHSAEVAMGRTWDSNSAKAKWQKLFEEIKNLNHQIATYPNR